MTQKKRRLPGISGFTLLEVVVSMLLLAIGLLALMALQIRAVRSNSFSNCLTMASSFARNQVETLRADSEADWDSVADGTFTDTVPDIDSETGETRRVFTRQWEIETDSSGQMRNISVTVSWTQDGRLLDTTVNTAIANRQ